MGRKQILNKKQIIILNGKKKYICIYICSNEIYYNQILRYPEKMKKKIQYPFFQYSLKRKEKKRKDWYKISQRPNGNGYPNPPSKAMFPLQTSLGCIFLYAFFSQHTLIWANIYTFLLIFYFLKHILLIRTFIFS